MKIDNYTKKLKEMLAIFLIIIATLTIIVNTALSLPSSENLYENAQNIDIITYYRDLGSESITVETSDLLNAADDWRNNIIPSGFSLSITTSQLLILADEWRTGITTIPTLVMKQETVGLNVLKDKNIPLENLTVSTLVSEDILTKGETTASVTVVDANKGQITFVSNKDGNPFVVAYMSASDIQNGITNITLESIANGFIMTNPLMFGFKDSDRISILAQAKNAPLYQDLKNEINAALQTVPNNLLENEIFPKIYEDATLLIIDSIKSLGGNALSHAVVNEIYATSDAIVGQEGAPYLNDLGSGKIEAVNPTMVFYGINIPELNKVGVIPGKESQWDLSQGFPLRLPPFTNPEKEEINIGDGYYTVSFSKANFDNAAGKGSFSANFLKTLCIGIDILGFCPITNKAIESTVENGPMDSQTMSLIGKDFFDVKTALEIYDKGIKKLSSDAVWKYVSKGLSIGDAKINQKTLQGMQKTSKFIILAHDLPNQYLPFAYDIAKRPDDLQYCVTETDGVLLKTCEKVPPSAYIIMKTSLAETYVGKEILFDAYSSSDLIYSTGSLLVRWDFNNDGVFEKDWSTNKDASWIYDKEGVYAVILEVKNQGGLLGYTIYTVDIKNTPMVTPTVPPTPKQTLVAPSDVNLAIVSDGTGIGVGWKDNSNNEDGFDIGYSSDPIINEVKHERVIADQTFLSSDWGLKYDQNGLLSPGQKICFQVSAYNSAESSDPTSWNCITIPQISNPQPQHPPEIVNVETFSEGDLVYFRVFFTDLNNDAEGFGFRGANGAGWGEETHSFSSPSYGRVSPGQIEYPFNHACETGPTYESDVEVWIYDSTGLKSPSVTVHLACDTAPKDLPTPAITNIQIGKLANLKTDKVPWSISPQESSFDLIDINEGTRPAVLINFVNLNKGGRVQFDLYDNMDQQISTWYTDVSDPKSSGKIYWEFYSANDDWGPNSISIIGHYYVKITTPWGNKRADFDVMKSGTAK